MATPLPSNRAAFTLGEIADATGGTLAGGDAAARTVSVSTDTRGLAEGALFVALAGSSFDGHDHLAAARAAGATAAVVDRDVATPPGLALVRVARSIEALGALGRAHARRWRKEPSGAGNRKVVAITGSAGKTTTRVAIQALLEHVCPGEVHASAGNLNNLVGVPMVLFGLEARHRLAVLEVGTNAVGEVAALAAISEPDAGVLTLIAPAHMDGFGSIEGVAREKSALFAALPPAGLAVGNVDDPRVQVALGAAGATRRIGYGTRAGAEVRIVMRDPLGLDRARVIIDRAAGRVSIEAPLIGEAGALAIAAAVALVEALLERDLDSATLGAALASADVGAGAGRLVPASLADGLALIDDSYNANPASMAASIRAAAEIARLTGKRLVLVLGEMRELGDRAAALHTEVGRVAAESGAVEVIAVGGHARLIAEEARTGGVSAAFADDAEEAAGLTLSVARPTDLVLVKGSRGVATERVARALEAAHGMPTGTQGSDAS